MQITTVGVRCDPWFNLDWITSPQLVAVVGFPRTIRCIHSSEFAVLRCHDIDDPLCLVPVGAFFAELCGNLSAVLASALLVPLFFTAVGGLAGG